MERKKPQMDQQKWKALQNYADNGKGLLRALAGYSYYRYGGNWYTELWNALTKLYSKPITQLSAKEFLCRDLENAFTTLAGKEMAEKAPFIIAIRLKIITNSNHKIPPAGGAFERGSIGSCAP